MIDKKIIRAIGVLVAIITIASMVVFLLLPLFA
jgi:hypothetical protein